MIKQEGIFWRGVRALALRLFHLVENNGNCNVENNGEKKFIQYLFQFLQRHTDKRRILTLFDIGANVGNYTDLLIAAATKIGITAQFHIFEPTYFCYNIIQHKFSNNQNVIINHAAVSDKTGRREIFYDKAQSGLASLHKRDLRAYSIALDQSELIKTIRLDEYINRQKITHVGFIKMDIEGHEMLALQGMGPYLHADFVDFIQFEYGGANLDSHTSLMELYGLLESRGFVLAKIMPKGLQIRSYEPWMDNFAYANYVAIAKETYQKLA